MRKLVLTAALAGIASLAVPSGAHADQHEFSAEDPTGDWGANVDTTISPMGSALGQDLVLATLTADYEADVMRFVIGVAELPAPGGTPEASRYVWSMSVDGKHAELDGKFTNYSRGACDPTAGTCPPTRDPGATPFLFRSNCVVNEANVIACQELTKFQATFDQPAGTITIEVPISTFDLLNVGDCPSISSGDPALDGASGFVVATPSAFYSTSDMPIDSLDDYTYNTVSTCEPSAE